MFQSGWCEEAFNVFWKKEGRRFPHLNVKNEVIQLFLSGFRPYIMTSSAGHHPHTLGHQLSVIPRVPHGTPIFSDAKHMTRLNRLHRKIVNNFRPI